MNNEMSTDEYRRWLETKEAKQQAKKKTVRKGRNKYNAKKQEFAGRKFDSGLEVETYKLLLLREKAGEISDINHQVQTHITAARVGYRADFRYFCKRRKEYIYAEAKGLDGERWQVIKKLWTVYGLGKLEIYKSGKPYPKLQDTITPHPV